MMKRERLHHLHYMISNQYRTNMAHKQ